MSAIGMPPHMLILFQARPLLEYYKPIIKKKPKAYTGISEFLNYFENEEPPPRIRIENKRERKERKKKERIMYNELILKEKRKNYDPFKNVDLTSDPKKTLFIGRLSYEVNEKKLKKEFEIYGKIKKVKVIYNHSGKPRGYAFIEFEHTKSLIDAYNLADGKKIDNRRILVDKERSRVVKNWYPRRLGGGKGPARGSEEKKKLVHNVNWNALINKDRYKNDKYDRYIKVPLYNERDEDIYKSKNTRYKDDYRKRRSKNFDSYERHYKDRNDERKRYKHDNYERNKDNKYKYDDNYKDKKRYSKYDDNYERNKEKRYKDNSYDKDKKRYRKYDDNYDEKKRQ